MGGRLPAAKEEGSEMGSQPVLASGAEQLPFSNGSVPPCCLVGALGQEAVVA